MEGEQLDEFLDALSGAGSAKSTRADRVAFAAQFGEMG